jgi:methionine-rich copper-binding protein CopC
VGLKALPPGTYQVHWRVLSVDTHKTEGNFSFSVGQ